VQAPSGANMASTSDISVVVCANADERWNDLTAAVEAHGSQPHQPGELIVVVDHNPRLFERARAAFGTAHVVENTHARGLGGARNSGLEAASGSVVAYIDDDAVPSAAWLPALAEWYSEPAVAGVGGGVEPVWKPARPDWFPREFDWVVGCSYLGQPETPQEVRNLFGCNMSYRRELLEALEGFRLGYGCDETELCIRLRQRWPDKKLVYVPQAKVLHNVPANRARPRRFLKRCYFEGGSKAVVSQLVGANQALSTEYRYTREVLPRGVRTGILSFVRRREPGGLGRATAIVAGLASTSAGYAVANLSPAKAARQRGWSGDWAARRATEPTTLVNP
jgi:GT2 family glycosyltransferase